MKQKARIGFAFREPTNGKPGKFHYNVGVDMGGVILPMRCRIAENTKREKETSPHFIMFSVPGGDQEGTKVGAFWTKTAKESGSEYLDGVIEVRKFGKFAHPGGAVTDFSLTSEDVKVKLCELKEHAEGAPTHILLRKLPIKRDVQGARASSEPEVVEAEEMEEEVV